MRLIGVISLIFCIAMSSLLHSLATSKATKQPASNKHKGEDSKPTKAQEHLVLEVVPYQAYTCDGYNRNKNVD